MQKELPAQGNDSPANETQQIANSRLKDTDTKEKDI
jgi:hypothetical protein